MFYRNAMRVAAFLVLATIAAMLSFATTNVHTDFAFPDGIFRITVRSESGDPVEGAVLSVHRTGTAPRLRRGPFMNCRVGQTLASDAHGQIRLLRASGVVTVGSRTEFSLFWVIPIVSEDRPRFSIGLRSQNHEPLVFPVDDLFQHVYAAYAGAEAPPEAVICVGGTEWKSHQYDHAVVLRASPNQRVQSDAAHRSDGCDDGE